MNRTHDRKYSLQFTALAIGVILTAASAALHAQPAQPIAQASTAKDAATYTYARQLYDKKRYSAAYGKFINLADAGHAPSAQMALAMFTHGETLFNTSWSATPDQQKRWALLVQSSTQDNAAIKQTGDRG